ARAGETHYPDARGTPALREALVRKLAAQNGITCEPDDIVVTVGGTHALFVALQTVLGPGDELLVPSPHWMAVPQLVGFVDGAGRGWVAMYRELMVGRGTGSELRERLRAAIRPETRALYLNSPHNPTGAVLDEEVLRAIADVAIERDLWVVSDEAYEHMLF